MMKLYLINLTLYQTIYITVLIAGGLLIMAVTAYFIFKRVWCKKHFKEATYLKLARFAKINDFLLLNNFKIDFDDTHIGVVDHILISKKYIFVINDFDISGVITGELKGQCLRIINKKKQVSKVLNPLNYNINLIKRINIYNHLDRTFVKGIVNVNNDSYIDDTLVNDQFMMVKRRNLTKTIASFDKEKIGNLKEEDVVNFINKLSKKEID